MLFTKLTTDWLFWSTLYTILWILWECNFRGHIWSYIVDSKKTIWKRLTMNLVSYGVGGKGALFWKNKGGGCSPLQSPFSLRFIFICRHFSSYCDLLFIYRADASSGMKRQFFKYLDNSKISVYKIFFFSFCL